MNSHTQKTKGKSRIGRRVLLLIATVITAIAVAVTCALCIDTSKRVATGSAEQGEVQTSSTSALYTTATAYNFATATTLIGDNKAGKLVNGDVLTFEFVNNGVYTVTLPRGTYTLSVWGAQGGTGYGSTTTAVPGAYGGYATGTWDITATTTIYIYVGGKGTDAPASKAKTSALAGGYNGGGNSGANNYTSSYYKGAGGGGATHISKYNALLKNHTTTANRNNILIVAGGGGGAGYLSTYSVGHGGGTSGSANCASGGSHNATGGTQTTYGSDKGTHGSRGGNGSFGQGGVGATKSSASGGGGGGGGYWGGGGGDSGNSTCCGGGGGGSGYIGGVTSGSMSNGARSGNGLARITVVNVNKAPVTNSYSVTLPARGLTCNQVITASALAKDPDPESDTANAGSTKVYFTNGNISATNAYDTFTATDNTNLFVDAACSKPASEYFQWSWSATSGTLYDKLTIKKVLKYPRSGYDGCTTNGTITLYARIRDNYGIPASRSVSVIPFTVTVAANTLTKRGVGNNLNTINASILGGTNGTTVIGTNKVYFGNSANVSAPTTGAIDSTKLYNPLGAGRYTAFFEQPLRYDEPVKINASDLVLGDNNNAVVSTDKIVVSLNSVAAITGTARKYQLDEYQTTPAGGTAYNTARAKLSNVYETLTFRCVTPDPAYQVFTVTIYQVEKVPVTALGLSNVVPNVTAITLDLVFKMDNTRPALRDLNNNDWSYGPTVRINTLDRKTFNLNDFYSDVDAPDGSTISDKTHQIREVIVPTHEYIQINKYGEITSTYSTKTQKSYFNVIATSTATDKFDNAVSKGQLKGDEFKTGFEDWYISDGSANKNNYAFIQYSYANDQLTITGLRATYSMYKAERTGYQAAIGGTSAAPTMSSSENITVANAGHFYILIRVQDKNDTSDEGIWLPLGIEVLNRAPNTIDRERNDVGSSEMPNANGKPNDEFYFTPMGITVNQTVTPLGLYARTTSDGGVQYTSDGLKPLAADADNFFSSNMLNGVSLTASGQATTGKLNELVRINKSESQLQTSIDGNSTGYYFTVELIDIYIPAVYFGGRVKKPTANVNTVPTIATESIDYYGTTECVVVKGIKVTLKSWTHNRYLHLNVEMIDSAGATSTVQLAVNVSNKAPEYLDANKVAQIQYTTEGRRVSSSYTNPTDDAVATIRYSVPIHSNIIVTPYDLVTDPNMPTYSDWPTGSNGAFTLNGLSGMFDSDNGVFTVNGASSGQNDTRTQISALATSANTKNGAYNYSDSRYTEKLFSMINGLQATRTFSAVSADNSFAKSVSGTTWVDRLYFARTVDSSNLDAFAYNQYSTANIKQFAAPDVAGADFVKTNFGSQLVYGGNTYYLDYLVINADKRTVSGSPVTIDLTVRDRTGASATGNAYGVKKIRIEIDIVNSSPRVQYPNKYYTLTTNPIGEESVKNVQTFVPDSIKPSTLVIYAASDSENLKNNLLIDNEDNSVWFDASKGCEVVDKPNTTGGTSDANGYSYNGYYVNATISSTAITVTALNSTQAIKELYIRFYATDGRYGDNGLLETSECYIRIEVINAALQYNTSDNGFEKIALDANNNQYLWNVESLNSQDETRARYFVSGSNAASAVTANGASAGQIKYVVSDTDRLQGAMLSAANNPQGDNIVYLNAAITTDMTADQKLAAYRNAVPRLGKGNTWGGAAALISLRSGVVYDGGSEFDKKVDMNTKDGEESNTDIIYFIQGESGYTAYSAKSLTASGDFGDEEFRKKFFDDEGRWIVTDWAVRVTPKAASDANVYINLRLSIRDEAKYGGDTAGKDTASKAGESGGYIVKSSRVFEYDMFINGIGIVPYTYYNQFDGYYTVADGADSSIVYVPTYDGTAQSQYEQTSTIKSLYYDSTDKVISTSGAEADSLKSRSANGTDGTLAGIHSGIKYSVENTKATNGYTYPVRDSLNSGLTESAFKFSDTIKVSGDSTKYTYVPMSYFGLNLSLVNIDASSGVITFPTNSYVSYDTGNEDPYIRMTGYQSAVTIRDGLGGVWSGNQVNPYVSLEPYDLVDSYDATDAREFNQSPYFNHNLSLPTYEVDKATEKAMASSFVAKAKTNSYANNIVGDDGRLMYLANQESITGGLQEHLFGLKIKKNNARSQAANLTITINIVQCTYSESESGTKVNYGGTAASKAKNTASVTFKLEIGNSPINLKSSQSGVTTGVGYDDGTSGVGYYTELMNLTTDSGTQYISLSRSSSVEGANRVIEYEDDDVAWKNENGAYISKNDVNSRSVMDESKSDVARFYYGSLHKLSEFTQYSRVAEYTGSGSDISFANVSNKLQNGKQLAQMSISSYFNAWSESKLAQLDGDYKPNYGKFASANGDGFDKYFSVGLSADSTTLSITPKAKTTINSAMLSGKDAATYYSERGLRYNNGRPYYPLKVLIYDDHGDGFDYASYVALEIRVAISGTAAKLSDNLDKSSKGSAGSKEINVSLALGQPYKLSLSSVLTGGNLIKDATSNNIFWAANYQSLKTKVEGNSGYSSESQRLEDMFKLESGTYLQSPFDDINSIQQYSTNANALRVDNETLRNGAAVYSSNPNYTGILTANLPDVIMYMDYYRIEAGNPKPVQAQLNRGDTPTGNEIMFKVNRRTTYVNNGVSVQKNDFYFKINFADSDGNTTNDLYVNITVTNQAPNLRNVSDLANNLQMQVGDRFTVVTTPYNRFVGSEEVTDSDTAPTPTASALASITYNVVNNRVSNGYEGITEANLLGRNANPRYETLTTYNLEKSAATANTLRLHSYASNGGSNQHLGYLAIADDDMPWGLRISDVAYYDDKCFETAKMQDVIQPEGKNESDGKDYCLDVTIIAKAVCKNMPVTITVVDADMAAVTFTMYVTVVSSKPVAIGDNDTLHTLNGALNPVYASGVGGQPVLQTGVYSMYMLANNVADQTETKLINNASTVTKTYKSVTLSGSSRPINAYGYVRLPIEEVAYDRDSGDVLAMYNETRADNSYNVVTLNNAALERSGTNVYYNDIFTITVSSDFRWFSIECKTYNPSSDEDVLRFYVRDSGNDIFENAIPIEIRICTLYSSVTNAAQMTNTAIRQEQFQRNSISTVTVKSFDDYSGISADLPTDEAELAKIKDVESTFQFLTYPDMPASVDQTENSAKPMSDPDVMLDKHNLNYELRIYAFMSKVGTSESEFEALSLENISSLFNLQSSVISKRVLALKSDSELKNNSFLNERELTIDSFLVGGFFADGISMTNVNRSLLMFLQRYFIFDIGADGVSLTFRPISANIDVAIPMYVEITKNVSDNRSVKVTNIDTTCGDIFYVNVTDSAPIVNDKNENVLKFTGTVGQSVVFKMYDENDPFGSLFTDSDLNDTVVYDGFVSATVQTPDYAKALAEATDKKIDWQANESIQKPAAITISVNNANSEVNGMPAHSVKITINRRIDVKDKGEYLEEVKLPVSLFVKDRGGKVASVSVTVTIQNSDIDIDRTKLTPVTPDTKNGYYQMSADETDQRLYYIDAYIVPGKTMAPFYFVDRNKESTFINDPDHTTMRADIDSMRLVGRDGATSDTYLMYGKTLSVSSEKEKEPIATVTPIFGNDIMPSDEYHFVGFSIVAHTYNREIDDATATMRVIDRSGDPAIATKGFTVTLRIHILNAPPSAKSTDIKSYVVTGSDTQNGTPIAVDINDFIMDLNGDKLRIVGIMPVHNDDPSKDKIHCVLSKDRAGDIVDIEISENQSICSMTPRAGYYGEQDIVISVADIVQDSSGGTGNYGIVDFTVRVVVAYNISQIHLNDVTAVRSLPKTVDAALLFASIDDTYGMEDDSKEQPDKFNPGDDYVITDLSAAGVKVTRNGDKWEFVGESVTDQVRFNVTFKNKSAIDDPNVAPVHLTFNASIGKNTSPELLENFKNVSEEGYLFQSKVESDYALDNNGTVTLTPQMLFRDKDIDDGNGDVLTFDPKSISVSSPTVCSVRVSEDGTLLYLTFNYRGECDLTVGVKDRTGETSKYTFKIRNIDRPEPSFWDSIVISYETNPLIWWGIGIGILVLIALIILIILLVKRRKRKQEELEAILISEMELEEQMMRLSAGSMGAAPYQSYGYLPPTMPVQNDPNLMLGSGAPNPNNGSIGLNPGSDTAQGDNGVSTDSDM